MQDETALAACVAAELALDSHAEQLGAKPPHEVVEMTHWMISTHPSVIEHVVSALLQSPHFVALHVQKSNDAASISPASSEPASAPALLDAAPVDELAALVTLLLAPVPVVLLLLAPVPVVLLLLAPVLLAPVLLLAPVPVAMLLLAPVVLLAAAVLLDPSPYVTSGPELAALLVLLTVVVADDETETGVIPAFLAISPGSAVQA